MVSRVLFLLAVFSASFSGSGACASPLVFQFTNPAFNSQSTSGDYLLDAAGINRGHGSSETPTYQILEINNGAIVLQTGEGNRASVTIQSGNGNSAQTSQTVTGTGFRVPD